LQKITLLVVMRYQRDLLVIFHLDLLILHIFSL
jgi:hypothetical protein